MSGRRIELSATQVTSSVLAAVTGAIVASSLGVAGTIIGVAVVSFATTAGTAVYRHYLGRTQERLRTAASARGHLAVTTPHTRAANGRTHVTHAPGQGDGASAGVARSAGAQQAGPGPSGTQLPTEQMTRPGREGQPTGHNGQPPRHNGRLADRTWIVAISDGPVNDGPASHGQVNDGLGSDGLGSDRAAGGTSDSDLAGGSAARRDGLPGVAGWIRTTRWLRFAAVAVMIFVLAMGGITILEAATGKPLDALIWGAHSSGTTVSNAVNGPAQRSHQAPAKPAGTPTPHRTHASHTATPSPSPTTPTPSPSTSAPSPTPTPAQTPSPSVTPSSGASRSPGVPATLVP